MERVRQRPRRRFVPAAGLPLRVAHVDEAAQERSGRHDGRATRERRAVLQRQAGQPAASHGEPCGRALPHGEVRRRIEDLRHLRGVEGFVRLAAEPAHGGSPRAVEHLELDRRAIRDEPHRATQRVDLAHDLSFREAPDRGVAAHAPDRRALPREEKRLFSEARRGERGLTTGMAPSDDDDVPPRFHPRHSTCPRRTSRRSGPEAPRWPSRP